MIRGLGVLCFLLMVFSLTPAMATPPASVTAEYNFESASLILAADHRSTDLNEHYVRKAEITINGERLETVYYKRQSSADRFTAEVPLDLEPGDAVVIKLFCREGGVVSTEIAIPKREQAESES